MEAHPVPQNVTSFEFHLVGDMTLKQFGYLAAGIGVAYLLFITLGSDLPVIVWPISIISSLLGVAFAFLPISERPLDHWVGAFFKSIFSPTQRVWSSRVFPMTDPNFKNRLNLALSKMVGISKASEVKISSPPLTPLVAQQTAKPLMPTLSNPSKAAPVIPANILPSAAELHQTVELAKKASQIQTQIVRSEQELNMIKTAAAAPDADAKDFTNKFQKVVTNLQSLTNEASAVSNELTVLSHQTPGNLPTTKVVIPTIKKSAPLNLSLTTTPNIINGIITDTQNNYLEGVIVVTHDKQGLPVRALKTNKLGQFVAATPLPNGNYTLSLEKDNLSFGNIIVELTGKILPPVMVAAEKRGLNG